MPACNGRSQRIWSFDVFDPLDCDMAAAMDGAEARCARQLSVGRSLAHAGRYGRAHRIAGRRTGRRRSRLHSIMATYARRPRWISEDRIPPALDACGEPRSRVSSRARRTVRRPGPSGAPSRGRPDVLPTGRNFYSVDSRAVPTPTAWELGSKSAETADTRYIQDHGDWPTSLRRCRSGARPTCAPAATISPRRWR